MDIDGIPVARTRWQRLRGLAWRRRASAGRGLVIPRCHSVHTFGMLFRLDLFFYGEDGALVREVRGVSPGRVVSCRRARTVVEVPSIEGE